MAFFGFCALTVLFVGYLFDRQRTFAELKHHLLAELERNLALQIQPSQDLLKSMPDLNHFWDRLTMEFRRARSMEKNLSPLLVKVKPGARSTGNDQNAPLSDAAKSMARRLRLFGIVLPETDRLNSKRIAVRFQDELQGVRAHYGCSFDLSTHNYPDQVKSEHELEDIVKSLLSETEAWREAGRSSRRRLTYCPSCEFRRTQLPQRLLQILNQVFGIF